MPARRVIKFAHKQNTSSAYITFQKGFFWGISCLPAVIRLFHFWILSHKVANFAQDFFLFLGKHEDEPRSLFFILNIFLHCFFLLL